MHKMNKILVLDEAIFDSADRRSLADVLVACEAEMTGNALRDTRSASASSSGGAGSSSAPSSPGRRRSGRYPPGFPIAPLGVSEKRLANVSSLIGAAVAQFGMRRTWITREIPLDENWAALLDRISNREHRRALSRLACYCTANCYCTAKGVAPADITPVTLRGLHAALEAEALSKDPRNLLKHTIAVRNMCLRRVPDWPGAALSSPFKVEPFMLPLDAFRSRSGRRWRSGGGLCYGYEVIVGEERGGRAINLREAQIVRRIFEEFATGRSPKAIARRLNDEGVRGPRGMLWRDSAIRGHRAVTPAS